MLFDKLCAFWLIADLASKGRKGNIMKMKNFTRAVSAVLAALTLAVNASALDFGSLGVVDRMIREEIGGGLIYTEVKSSGNVGSQSSYIFEYTPGSGTLPIVSYNKVYGRDQLAELITEDTLGAVNGDFYSLQTGIPMGIMIDDGFLLSTSDDPDSPGAAIGFKADGSAMIGRPEISLSILNMRSMEKAEIEYFNKYPLKWGAYLLDSSYSSSTTSTESSLEIVIEVSSRLRLGESLFGIVREIRKGSINGDIPEGCMVLTVTDSSSAYSRFSGYKLGDELLLSVSCTEEWKDVVTAIGGGDIILENGVMPDGIIDEGHEKNSNPRTAIGIRSDGSVVIYAVDGRSSSSRGLTESELSTVMSELGCITALNLDGGGSTTVMVKYSAADDCIYVNSPSDGKPRTISNALLLISADSSDGIPAGLSPTIKTPLILSGESLNISAYIRDRAYRSIGEAENVTVIAPEAAGCAVGSIFTAGDKAGIYELTLSSDGLYGVIYVIVTDELDSIELSPSYSRAYYGSPVALELSAKYRGEEVICELDSFCFTLNGTHILPDAEEYPDAMIACELGYLTKELEFVAFEGAIGEVEVGVELGGASASVRIKVGKGDDEIPESAIYSNTLSRETVYPGYKSDTALSFSRDIDSDTAAEILCDIPIAKGARSISLWVNELPETPYCIVSDKNGKEHRLNYSIARDYRQQLGFAELSVELDESLSSDVCTLSVLLGFEGGRESIILDGARISYGDQSDAPISGLNGHWAAEAILRLYDMNVIEELDCKNEDGSLSYAPDERLTRGEFAKLISRWLGLDISSARLESIGFEEDTPEDKLPYIRAVISEGIMNGVGRLDEMILFNANGEITRQEVCKVLGGLIGTDDCEEIPTPSDLDQVAAWAVEGVNACISAGIISGYTDGSIRPEASVTRAELAVMLERAGA